MFSAKTLVAVRFGKVSQSRVELSLRGDESRLDRLRITFGFAGCESFGPPEHEHDEDNYQHSHRENDHFEVSHSAPLSYCPRRASTRRADNTS